MNLNHDSSTIIQKTRDLCQAILEDPGYLDMRNSIELFMADEAAKEDYRWVVEQGEYLQHKQQMGSSLDDREIQEFESRRSALVANAKAKAFLDAQQSIQAVHESVGKYVAKTFELGRLPQSSDFESESCGPSCGCH
ncbi:MAG: YlbF family regulator [Verrucomicrobia bacterium]|nr:YlbF family regulator [Verrucomicrobiota bacterium]